MALSMPYFAYVRRVFARINNTPDLVCLKHHLNALQSILK